MHLAHLGMDETKRSPMDKVPKNDDLRTVHIYRE